MPPLKDHQSTSTTKLLLIGDSGGGKTGSLASLADAGYNLRILDTDNGLDVLRNLLDDPKSPYKKDSIDRVEFRTLTDKMKSSGGRTVPVQAKVWQESMKMLDHWKYDYSLPDGTIKTIDLGPVNSWTEKEILVIDSLSSLSKSALKFILSLNGRLGQKPFQSDWWDAQTLVLEGLLERLFDESLKCNVIVLCHVAFIGEEGGPLRGYPNTIGKALSPKVGQYFNTALLAKSVGQGSTIKRKILTNTSGVIDLKNTAPLKVAQEYDIGDGLAKYFAAVRS